MSKNITFMAPIESVSGKLAPSTARAGYGNWKRYFSVRTLSALIYEAGGTPRNVMAFHSRGRSTPYTASELAAFDKFASVSRRTAQVMKNPQSLNQALIEFKAQSTYKTLRNYVWHREWENYNG